MFLWGRSKEKIWKKKVNKKNQAESWPFEFR